MTVLMYLLYAAIVVFIMLLVLDFLNQQKVKPEKEQIIKEEYNHFESDLAPMVQGAGGAASVVLKEVPISKQLGIMKEIRTVTNLALKDAKILMESAPIVIKKNIRQEEAQTIKEILESAGAVVEIKEREK